LLTKINTVIFYAWNEHDEGSWLCPTLAVDEQGNQLYNEDGTKKINDSRIKILKKATEDFNNGKRSEVIINGVSNLTTKKTPAPSATNSPDNTNSNNKLPVILLVGIGAGAVVVAGGVFATILIIKKKNKKEETENEQG